MVGREGPALYRRQPRPREMLRRSSFREQSSAQGRVSLSAGGCASLANRTRAVMARRRVRMMLTKTTIAALIMATWSGSASAQDIAAGEAAFRKCQPCHDVGETARNKLGPTLNGLDGRQAGTVDGYDYSEANKNSGVVWSEATFKEYTIDPAAKMPGTKMMFSDKNENEIEALWSYLKQFGPDGQKK